MRQLAGMRGLMAKPSARSSRRRSFPIQEGLRCLKYFNRPRRPQGSGGYRVEDGELGLPDAASWSTWRRTASSRRMIAAPARIMMPRHHRRRHGGCLAGVTHSRRTNGETARPATNKIVVKRGTLMEETHVDAIQQAGIQK